MHVVCFVHIYQFSLNLRFLDFLQSYFQIHSQWESGMSGIPAFSPPMQIWRYSWIWSQQAFCFGNDYDQNIELESIGQQSSKPVFLWEWVRFFLAIFSLNVYSAYGSQQRGVKNYFWSWIRNGKDVPEITSVSLMVSGAGTLCLRTCCWVFKQRLSTGKNKASWTPIASTHWTVS